MTEIISGVYEIRNTQNGHRYIGSSCNIQHRWKGHLLSLTRGKHHSPYLQRSWERWGADCFELKVLETCDRSQLAEREQFYIDTLKPVFNACPVAYSCKGLIRSPETIAKLRLIHLGEKQSEETKAKRSATMKGHPYWGKRKHTPETLAKMSATRKGRKVTEKELARRRADRLEHPVPAEVGRKISASKMGHTVSEETRAKIAAAKLGTHRTQETKDKIGKGSLGRTWTQEHKEKFSASRMGHPLAQETLEKKSASMRIWWANKRLQKEIENG